MQGRWSGARSRPEVLRAFPVRRGHPNNEQAFDDARAIGDRQLGGEIRIVPWIEDLEVSQNLEAFPVGIVHEEQGDFVACRQVPGRLELSISPEVGKAEGLRIEDSEEPRRSTPMLDVRPPILVDGRQGEAVPSLTKPDFLIAQRRR